MSRVFIVRHGNTFAPGDTVRRIGARTDLPLVASGVAQAEAIGAWLAARGIRFTRVLAGPLRRTRETATAILARLPDAPVPAAMPWLDEIDHGPDEGQPEPIVRARLGEAALARWDSDAVPPSEWTVNGPQRRAAWSAFWATPPDGDTLIVTSNGAARFALLASPGLAAHRPLKLRTGALGEVFVAPDGSVELIDWDVRPPAMLPRPAAFLDRDGVINIDSGFPYLPEHLAFTPSAAAGIRLLNEQGYWAIVVTNQSGVARGLFDLAAVDRFHAHIAARLAADGARIDAFYVAPYHPQGSVPAFAIDHEDRKPGAGMLLRAMREWPIDRRGSFMVGDKPSDMAAAAAAGIPGVLVPADTCDLQATVRAQLSLRALPAAT